MLPALGSTELLAIGSNQAEDGQKYAKSVKTELLHWAEVGLADFYSFPPSKFLTCLWLLCCGWVMKAICTKDCEPTSRPRLR